MFLFQVFDFFRGNQTPHSHPLVHVEATIPLAILELTKWDLYQ